MKSSPILPPSPQEEPAAGFDRELHLLVMRDDPAEITRAIREHHLDPNGLDRSGNTPLHFAIWNRRCQVIQVLLDQGANPNIRNSKGDTPFHHFFTRMAPHGLADPYFDLLLDAGADPSIPSAEDVTAYHLMVLQSYVPVSQAIAMIEKTTARFGVAGWTRSTALLRTPRSLLVQAPAHAQQQAWCAAVLAAVDHARLEAGTPKAKEPNAKRSLRL